LWLRTTTTDQTVQAVRVIEERIKTVNITGVCTGIHVASRHHRTNREEETVERDFCIAVAFGLRLHKADERAHVLVFHRRIYDPLL
jgi:hypothetical protein